MAQALYSGHPVEEYLRDEAGERDPDALLRRRHLPGIHEDFDETTYPLPPWDLRFLAPVLSYISSTVREEQRLRKMAEEFAEHFKYRLVSSSMLSSTGSAFPSPMNFQTATSTSASNLGSPLKRTDIATSPTPSSNIVPGKWELPMPQTHYEDEDEDDTETLMVIPDTVLWPEMDLYTWLNTLPPIPLVCAALLVLLRFPILLLPVSVLALPFLPYPDLKQQFPTSEEACYSKTLAALDSLIVAYETWDQATSSALSIIPPSSSSFTSSPPLAHSLQTAITQTTTHVSTIRGLLSALARSSKELQMLESMYGPQSPPLTKSSFQAHERVTSFNSVDLEDDVSTERSRSHDRRYAQTYTPRSANASFHTFSASMSLPSPSVPSRLQRSISASSLHGRSASANASPIRASPTPSLSRAASASVSARLTPFRPRSRARALSKPSSLSNISLNGIRPSSAKEDRLSHAALARVRDAARANIRHTAGCLLGLRFLSSPPESGTSLSFTDSMPLLSKIFPPDSHHTPPSRRMSRRDSFFSMSDLGSDGTPDLEFLDALDYSQSADPAYWEDVRSVMGLFKSALEDASERLGESMSDASRGAMSLPSPPPEERPLDFPASRSGLREQIGRFEPNDGRTTELLGFLKRGNNQLSLNRPVNSSFAPLPSNLSRFVHHIEAMQDALNEAKLSLRETVESLAASSSPVTPPTSPASARTSYDRLRSALGVALRECERGRGPLNDALFLPQASSQQPASIPEEPTSPALSQDDEYMDSYSQPSSPTTSSPLPKSYRDSDATIVEGGYLPHERDRIHSPTLHELLEEALRATSTKIPEGKEQVFEGDTLSSATNFSRQRTSLSRRERIKIAKDRREGLGETVPNNTSSNGLGPGTDVVQELKDAIWQVGERRRRSGVTTNGAEENGNDSPGPPHIDLPLLPTMFATAS